MTRAASSQASARATASAADRLAAGPLFAAFAAIAGFCRSIGASPAQAAPESAADSPSASHPVHFAMTSVLYSRPNPNQAG